jgi:hypothetical protein
MHLQFCFQERIGGDLIDLLPQFKRELSLRPRQLVGATNNQAQEDKEQTGNRTPTHNCLPKQSFRVSQGEGPTFCLFPGGLGDYRRGLVDYCLPTGTSKAI